MIDGSMVKNRARAFGPDVAGAGMADDDMQSVSARKLPRNTEAPFTISRA
jgi:hypothetical protein